MRVLAVALLLLTSVTCKTTTAPAYLVGPASFTVVLDSTAPVTGFFRIGDSVRVAYPGDSICVHFRADGNWQYLVLWNATWPRLEVQWAPVEAVRNVTQRFYGPSWRETSTSAALC